MNPQRDPAHSTHSPYVLPTDLPTPADDGACDHLRGAPLPDLDLPCTDGTRVNLRAVASGRLAAVLFFYPRTGVPGQPPHAGFRGESWDSIPGARGCTPQSCGYRDHLDAFGELGIRVFGVSTNTTEHQHEFKTRTGARFEFLSDASLTLVRAMRLPTFDFPVESGGPTTLLKRMAWLVRPDDHDVVRIARVWYPVFPPDRNAADVLARLRTTPIQPA